MVECVALAPDDDVELGVDLVVAAGEIEQLLGRHNEARVRLQRAYEDLADPDSPARVSVLIAASTNSLYLADGIRAVVSEGAGERVGEVDASGVGRILLAAPMAVMTVSMTVFGNHGPPPPIVDRIGLVAPRPIFLIYADPGQGGESVRQPKYFAAASRPKQIWKVPGAGQIMALAVFFVRPTADPGVLRMQRLKFHVAAWLLGMVVPTPLWALVEWQDNGSFERWSNNSQPGDWDPWILVVGGIWAFAALGLFAVRSVRQAPEGRSTLRDVHP